MGLWSAIHSTRLLVKLNDEWVERRILIPEVHWIDEVSARHDDVVGETIAAAALENNQEIGEMKDGVTKYLDMFSQLVGTKNQLSLQITHGEMLSNWAWAARRSPKVTNSFRKALMTGTSGRLKANKRTEVSLGTSSFSLCRLPFVWTVLWDCRLFLLFGRHGLYRGTFRVSLFTDVKSIINTSLDDDEHPIRNQKKYWLLIEVSEWKTETGNSEYSVFQEQISGKQENAKITNQKIVI